MKKSTACILSLIGLIVIIGLSVFFLKDYFYDDHNWDSNWSKTVTVKDGIPDPAESTQDFNIEKEGEYTLSYGWLPSGSKKKDISEYAVNGFGFFTAMAIFDESGEMIHSSAGAVLNNQPSIELKKGTYHAKYYYFTDLSQYEAFAACYLCGTYNAPYWAAQLKPSFDELQKSGTWTMEYHFDLSSQADVSTGTLFGILFGLSLSACLICLMLAAISKGNRVSSPKYDERQEMERGRGFKYAFISMSICLLIAYILGVSGVLTISQYQLLSFSSFIVALNVYVIYCIWHEAYFALNQKTKSVIILFTLIALFNLLPVINSSMDGSLIHNGEFDTAIVNLFMTITFLLLLATVLIKKFVDAKTNKRIEAADEEDE